MHTPSWLAPSRQPPRLFLCADSHSALHQRIPAFPWLAASDTGCGCGCRCFFFFLSPLVKRRSRLRRLCRSYPSSCLSPSATRLQPADGSLSLSLSLFLSLVVFIYLFSSSDTCSHHHSSTCLDHLSIPQSHPRTTPQKIHHWSVMSLTFTHLPLMWEDTRWVQAVQICSHFPFLSFSFWLNFWSPPRVDRRGVPCQHLIDCDCC